MMLLVALDESPESHFVFGAFVNASSHSDLALHVECWREKCDANLVSDFKLCHDVIPCVGSLIVSDAASVNRPHRMAGSEESMSKPLV